MGSYIPVYATDFIGCIYEVVKMGMTIEEIKQALHKADLALRPNILFVNPEDAKIIKESLPKIENDVVIQETELIEHGKAVVMKREKLEAWTTYENDD